MHRSIRSLLFVGVVSFLAMGSMTTPAISGGGSPTDGYDIHIHIQAPHMMANGTPGGPFHHYCKGI